jgi:transcription elongation factor GreA
MNIGNSRINAGCRVRLLNIDTDKTLEINVVSTIKAGVRFNQISLASPVGKALIGRSVGETIHVETPGGTMNFRILKIIHP